MILFILVSRSPANSRFFIAFGFDRDIQRYCFPVFLNKYIFLFVRKRVTLCLIPCGWAGF